MKKVVAIQHGLCYNNKALLIRTTKYAPIAQLDRAFDYGSKGCGFDSYWARHFIKKQFPMGTYISGCSTAW